MAYKICVVTGSRAEFGQLLPLINRIKDDKDLSLSLVVTGSHLDKDSGFTKTEVEASGVVIEKEIPLSHIGQSKTDMIKATGEAISLFGDYFTENRPDMLVVLGDRYEIFGVCQAAAMLSIPIAHLCGGETTEGAVDEFIRHSITKMSYLHFTVTDVYRKRVIQLGEDPKRVVNSGSLNTENILKLQLMNRDELAKSIDFDLSGDYSVVTFHPVTLEEDEKQSQLYELIDAMDKFPSMKFIITKANADAGGKAVNDVWEKEAKSRPNWIVVASLGTVRYLSALKSAKMMLGNSSSGIAEAPLMHLPSVNIGDRQKGRLMADSVICCEPDRNSIEEAMKKAISNSFAEMVKKTKSPFGDGHASEIILNTIKEFLNNGIKSTKKTFYDL